MMIWLICTALASSLSIDSGSINGYFSLSEIRDLLTNYSLANPSLILESIGTTYFNETIPALKFLSPHSPRILVVGGHHARELVSITQVLYSLDYLVQSLSKGEKLEKEIWFVPILNVDGFQMICDHFNTTGEILEIRKNIRPGGCNIQHDGVDLNRNYGYKWGYDNIGSSNNACDEDFRGESAFSELETQAIRELVKIQDFAAVISYHSYGDLYIRPTGYIQTGIEQFPLSHQNVYSKIEEILPYGAQFGSVQELLGYSANGALMDYLYDLGTFAIEIEVGPENYHSFHPGAFAIDGIVNSHLPVFLMIINEVDAQLVANVTTEGRKLSILVENLGLARSNVTTVAIKITPPVGNIRIKSEHPHEYVNDTLFVSIQRLESGEVLELRLLIDSEEQSCNVSVNFLPKSDKHINFIGEIRFEKKEKENLMIIIVIAIIVFLMMFALLCWCAFKNSNDDINFIELAEVQSKVTI